MSQRPSDNLRSINAFAQHMFALYTAELSHRTGGTRERSPLADDGPLSIMAHDCGDVCRPIIDNLASAFLNPGMTCCNDIAWPNVT